MGQRWVTVVGVSDVGAGFIGDVRTCLGGKGHSEFSSVSETCAITSIPIWQRSSPLSSSAWCSSWISIFPLSPSLCATPLSSVSWGIGTSSAVVGLFGIAPFKGGALGIFIIKSVYVRMYVCI